MRLLNSTGPHPQDVTLRRLQGPVRERRKLGPIKTEGSYNIMLLVADRQTRAAQGVVF
jgi:hypothetical protein